MPKVFASYGSLSEAPKIETTMRERPLTGGFLCAVAGGVMTAGTLSRWLRGEIEVDNWKIEALVKACHELSEIAKLCEPWPLDFHNAALWAELLAKYRTNSGAENEVKS